MRISDRPSDPAWLSLRKAADRLGVQQALERFDAAFDALRIVFFKQTEWIRNLNQQSIKRADCGESSPGALTT